MSDHKPYVTVTSGIRGYYAVLLIWNEDEGGFYEPLNTSEYSSPTREAAVEDAKSWAAAENVEYRA